MYVVRGFPIYDKNLGNVFFLNLLQNVLNFKMC